MVNAFIFLLLALLSEIVGTVGGFGSSVFFVPLAGFFFDFKTVLGLTGLLHVFSNIAKLVLFRQHIQWSLIWKIGVPSVLLVIAGAWLSNHVQFQYAEMLLGLFCMFFAVLFWYKTDLKLKPTNSNAVTGGGVAGFLAGFIGTGGAIRAVILTSFGLEKNIFIATSAAIDFGVDLSRSVIYVGQGYVQGNFWWYLPGLIVIAFVGSYIGKKLLNSVSPEQFRKVVLIFILLTGLVMTGKSLLRLF
ncbi:sulfite exporter TauE/SafE family protein [Sediminibacterium goheungense]|uniref:Probable membrane transporter protein n=1 Tax=Sediminibacterium goheungense TaxID=1086393 RepID=A0A4R6J0X7_9BACT|nr:sulfite exporter TauE/SafE family protein [Sediminibacterium goheungense]TDO28889.1 hypothetical protein BC659_0971 [Sediminibacterium goheungense]